MLTEERMLTLSLGLQAYQSQHGGTQWHLLMAASMIAFTALILRFVLTQRTFIQGVRLTRLKRIHGNRAAGLKRGVSGIVPNS